MTVLRDHEAATLEPLDVSPPQTEQNPGIAGWLTTVDHKRLGLMYLASSLIFFVVGGIEAALIRLQLAVPHGEVLSPQSYNQMFTMHGTTMVFLVGMPMIFGFGNYLVPLMIGARDMAFPRLNAFSFWLFVFAAVLLYFSFVGGSGLYGATGAPDVGWVAYSPLTAWAFSQGNGTDYWLVGVLVGGFASLATAANIICTIFTMRCPGMTLKRMPLFLWLFLVSCFMAIAALGPLSAAQIMVLCDRHLGANFFNPSAGGNVLLWQHLFWFFGHPEVYVLILPGFAYVSEIIPVFSRKVLFGYPVMVAATVAIGFIGLGAWAHHLFTIGMGAELNTLFVASTLLIAIPTGIKLFNWLATMYGGRIRMRLPMLFCIAFLAQFLFAGLSGVILAVAPFDWQLHDTYFVVAHFHYVLIGGLVFSMFAAFYYWYPKAFGKMLCERLGRWHFWMFTLGFHLTFLPMHLTGIYGMPRRTYTYVADAGWNYLNVISTFGVLFQGIGALIFVYNLFRSAKHGEEAGGDPWDAWTLEWAVTSPPPAYNFAIIPEVQSRRPLWDKKHPRDPDWSHE